MVERILSSMELTMFLDYARMLTWEFAITRKFGEESMQKLREYVAELYGINPNVGRGASVNISYTMSRDERNVSLNLPDFTEVNFHLRFPGSGISAEELVRYEPGSGTGMIIGMGYPIFYGEIKRNKGGLYEVRLGVDTPSISPLSMDFADLNAQKETYEQLKCFLESI